MTRAELQALARELAPLVAPLVVAQLAAALGAVEAPYSTRRGHEPPEYQGRAKRWKADAHRIPGAVRVGRWWSVPRAAYASWLASQTATPAPAQTVAANGNVRKPWNALDALASVGVRGTR